MPDTVEATPPGNDRALVQRLAAGDRSALAELYEQSADRVFTTVARILGPADARDVTHDAFLQAFARAHQFRHAGSLEGWVRRIAVNLALNRLRSWRRFLALRHRAGDLPSAVVRPAPAEALDLDRAIAALPTRLRVVFLLVSVEGWSHAQVAAQLRITEATSRKRYQRARAELASRISLKEHR